MSLARIGIGKLILVDFDKVEESNLNRQYYFRRHIGTYKALALEEVIKDITEDIDLEIHIEKIDEKNFKKLFKEVDILVEALDDADSKASLVTDFLTTFPEKKLVAASGISGYYSSNLIKTRKINNRFYLVGDGIEEEETKDIFLSPRVNIAAQHQANMVLRLILNEEEV